MSHCCGGSTSQIKLITVHRYPHATSISQSRVKLYSIQHYLGWVKYITYLVYSCDVTHVYVRGTVQGVTGGVYEVLLVVYEVLQVLYSPACLGMGLPSSLQSNQCYRILNHTITITTVYYNIYTVYNIIYVPYVASAVYARTCTPRLRSSEVCG